MPYQSRVRYSRRIFHEGVGLWSYGQCFVQSSHDLLPRTITGDFGVGRFPPILHVASVENQHNPLINEPLSILLISLLINRWKIIKNIIIL